LPDSKSIIIGMRDGSLIAMGDSELYATLD
jgi:hypothetical protein